MGIYWATHDPNGHDKTFGFVQEPANNGETGSLVGELIIKHVPINSNQGNTLHKLDFPIKIIPFEGNWYDAASIYREWVIPNAQWTQRGRMKDRGDTPAWAYNITTWINTHWQDIDIFNISGGDPRVVLQNSINIAKRFGLEKDAMALHWYEWDTLGYK